MRRTLSIFTLLLSLLLAAATCAQAAALGPDTIELEGRLVHPTRLLARPKASTEGGVSQGRRIILDETLPAALTLPGGNPDPRSSEAVAARLRSRLERARASGTYEWVEPDGVVRKSNLPGDLLLQQGHQWGLRNPSSEPGSYDIDADAAWAFTTGSPSVVVGILDTGLLSAHPEFAGALWVNPGESGNGRERNGRDDDGDGYKDNVNGVNILTGTGDFTDGDGHGTHVSGVIAARANNGHPLVGVAPGVKILPIRVLNNYGYGFTSDLIKGIEFATTRGVRVLNASLGGQEDSQALKEAIAAAGHQGVILVASSGNEGADNDITPLYPASYPLDNILVVTAVQPDGRLPYWANRGRESVDLAAPGTSILTTALQPTPLYSLVEGTSIATAFVSGVAALVLSREPSLSVGDLRSRLLDAVVLPDVVSGLTVTDGMINAHFAVNPAQTPARIRVHGPLPSQLDSGSQHVFHVSLRQQGAVPGATIRADLGDGLVFIGRDDGQEGDTVAGDGIHAVRITVPRLRDALTVAFSGSTNGEVRDTRTFLLWVRIRPEGDRFAEAMPLDPSVGNYEFSLLNAGVEPGEPQHAGQATVRSVWWRWKAPTDGLLHLIENFPASTQYIALAVYSGTNLASLTPLGSHYKGVSSSAKTLSIRVKAGMELRIAMASPEVYTDYFSLRVRFETAPAPANDLLANATPLPTEFPYSLQSSTAGAVLETWEHALTLDPLYAASVWWKLTPPDIGRLRLTPASPSGEHLVRLFRMKTDGALEELSLLPGWYLPRETVEHNLPDTRPLFIQVSTNVFSHSTFSLKVDLVSPLGKPVNDSFRLAPPLQPEGDLQSATTVDATLEPGEPALSPETQSGSIWWRWTAVSDARVTLTALPATGTNACRLSVYTGTSLSTLTAVPMERFESPLSVRTEFTAAAGVTYRIRLTTLGQGSQVELSLSPNPLDGRPINDAFSRALPLPLDINVTTQRRLSTFGATLEPGEPAHADPSTDATVWYRLSFSRAMTVTLQAFGRFSHRITLFRGTELSSLVPLIHHFEGDSASFAALSPSETYWLCIGGAAGGSGPLTLEAAGLPAESGVVYHSRGDHFAERQMLYHWNQGNLAVCTREAGEPDHAGLTGGVSQWWTFEGTGHVNSFLLSGENQDSTHLTLYAGTDLGSLTQIATTVGSNDPLVAHTAPGIQYQLAVHSNRRTHSLYQIIRYSDIYNYAKSSAVPVVAGKPFALSHALLQQADYRWRARPFGGAWFDLADGAIWTGTTTQTLRSDALPASFANHELQLVRRVGSELLTDYAPVRLAFGPPATQTSLVTQPASVTGAAGGSAGFSVSTAGMPPDSIVWQRQAPGSTSWNTVFKGNLPATGETLSVENLLRVESGSAFRAIINRFGAPPLVSSNAVLTVPGQIVRPAFATHPQEVTIETDSTAMFSVTLAEGAEGRIVWQVGTPDRKAWETPLQTLAQSVKANGSTLELKGVYFQANGTQVRAVLVCPGAPLVFSAPATLNVKRRPTQLAWVDKPLAYGATTWDVLGHSQLSLDSIPRQRTGLKIVPAIYGTLAVGSHTLTLEYDDSANGYEPAQLTFTVTIVPRRLLLQAIRRYSIEGNDPMLSSVWIRGRRNDYEAITLEENPVLRTTGTRSSSVGDYPIEVHGGRSSNFQLERRPGVLTILPSRDRKQLFALDNLYDLSEYWRATATGLPDSSQFYLGSINSNGFRYDGTSSLITLPQTVAQGLRSFTLSVWMQPTGTGTADASGRVPLMVKGNPAEFGLYWVPATRRVQFELNTTTGRQRLESNRIAPQGIWTHVAATFSEAAGIATLHLDALQAGTARGWGLPVGDMAPVTIGGSAVPGNGYFRGALLRPSMHAVDLHALEVRQMAQVGPDCWLLQDLPGLRHLGGAWYDLPWFGRFHSGAEYPWIHHEIHGWVYQRIPPTETYALPPDGFHLYDPKAAAAGLFGWAHYSEAAYPWIWARANDGSLGWWYFDTTSVKGARRFRDPAGTWHTVP